MKDIEFLEHAKVWESSPHWYEQDAALAIIRGHFTIIHTRSGEAIYLPRFWITPPVLDEDGTFDASNSLMLHYFMLPDEGALHDHPWDFRTTVLVGGYLEERPHDWTTGSPYGPRAVHTLPRVVGTTASRRATDLHRVASIQPGTWTLVRTGPKVRSWGFHPPGAKWIPWRDYIARTRATSDATPLLNHIDPEPLPASQPR